MSNDVDEAKFQFYKSFHHQEEAEAFIDFLKKHRLPYRAETTSTLLDSNIVGTALLPKVIIKLHTDYFRKANQLIEKEIANTDHSHFEDHYLNLLDDQELLDIFEHPDQWSIEDFNIAKIILRNRGINLDETDIIISRELRLAKIRKGKKGNINWMLAYALSAMLGLLLHPLFVLAGVGMGYYYSYGKVVDIDGNSHFVFDEKTRQYGKYILYASIFIIIIEAILLLNKAI